MGRLYVVKPGLQTTVQDLGRLGLQANGVSVAGPMDVWSHRVANALTCNPIDAATLEVTITGPELEFDDDRIAAVAGAEFVVTVDGRSMPTGQPFLVRRSSRLKFGQRVLGTRAYLAIAGGIGVPLTLGSRATHLPSHLGGLDGRALTAGDRLQLGPLGARQVAAFRSDVDARGVGLRSSRYSDRLLATERGRLTARLRVLPGPQADWFGELAFDVLQSAPYTVTTDSNRMGFRLDGPTLPATRHADMISEATPLGSLQVPASGAPILLMADRQTTGGYPKIAVVFTADMPVAGQLGPGDAVSFEIGSRTEAVAALATQASALRSIEGSPA